MPLPPLSSTTLRNPTFTPDVADGFVFELKASDASGNAAVTFVSLAGIDGDAAIAWLGVDDLRMLKPVKLGDTVRVIVEVKGQQPTSNPRKGVQVWRYTVRNQRDEEVMAFDYKMMFHMRG